MRSYDVIVVGGGPAGSSCARRLVAAGASVAVLDRDRFPRTKLCAGWITPEVVEDLELDVATYPHRFNTFERLVVHVKGLSFRMPGPQHSIRRYEFDHFLLDRSGAPRFVHTAKNVRRDGDGYVIDESIRCDYLVGAGGTRCPVYRTFFKEVNPRARKLQVVTYEHEFPYRWEDPRCHLWFFERGLPGYAWYVPKADGYLNCGIGGVAEKLKRRGEDIKSHWRHFTGILERALVRDFEYAPRGYSYYVRGDVDVIRIDNAFLTGDAAGLATRDLCEGIGPAVASGQLAAEAIVSGRPYSLAQLRSYSAERGLVRRLLEYAFVGRKPARPSLH